MGGSKLFDCYGLAVRWYQAKGTLTIKGEKAEVIKSKLLLLAKYEENESIQKEEVIAAIEANANFHIDTAANSHITTDIINLSSNELFHPFIIHRSNSLVYTRI